MIPFHRKNPTLVTGPTPIATGLNTFNNNTNTSSVYTTKYSSTESHHSALSFTPFSD